MSFKILREVFNDFCVEFPPLSYIYCVSAYFLRSDAMSENMFEDDEEVLQGDVVRLELSSELEAGVDDLLDDQLHDAHQVAALDHHRVSV